MTIDEHGRIRRGTARPVLVCAASALALIALAMSGVPVILLILIAIAVPVVAVHALLHQPWIRRLSLPMPGQLRIEAGAGTVFTGPARPLFASPFWCAFRIDDPAGRSPVIGLFPDELDAATWRRVLVAMRSD